MTFGPAPPAGPGASIRSKSHVRRGSRCPRRHWSMPMSPGTGLLHLVDLENLPQGTHEDAGVGGRHLGPGAASAGRRTGIETTSSWSRPTRAPGPDRHDPHAGWQKVAAAGADGADRALLERAAGLVGTGSTALVVQAAATASSPTWPRPCDAGGEVWVVGVGGHVCADWPAPPRRSCSWTSLRPRGPLLPGTIGSIGGRSQRRGTHGHEWRRDGSLSVPGAIPSRTTTSHHDAVHRDRPHGGPVHSERGRRCPSSPTRRSARTCGGGGADRGPACLGDRRPGCGWEDGRSGP